jgi:hypothetical protein
VHILTGLVAGRLSVDNSDIDSDGRQEKDTRKDEHVLPLAMACLSIVKFMGVKTFYCSGCFPEMNDAVPLNLSRPPN